MPADHGMLFVYPNDARHCMWMRNTYMPLSVAFLDGHGRVINTDEMVPRTDTSHCAAGPARYVLEMPPAGSASTASAAVRGWISRGAGAAVSRWRRSGRSPPRAQPDGVRSGGPSSSSM